MNLIPNSKTFTYDILLDRIIVYNNKNEIIFNGEYKNFKKFAKNRGEEKNIEVKNGKLFFDKIGDDMKSLYNFSKFNYINLSTKGILICPIHGEVLVSPNFLIKHKMCPLCYKEQCRVEKEINFIKRAQKIHKNEDGTPKYDYSKVHYINSSTPVEIIDEQYGNFFVSPNNHLQGKGNPYRIGKYKTTEQIIKEFIKIHGDRYDYSKVEYKDATTKVCVTCPIHGEFWITPNKHLQGRGCSKCKISHLENDVLVLLKELNIKFELHYKNADILGLKSLDFYLTDYNIAIECQGIQHFDKQDDYIFGLDDMLLKRDIEKNLECSSNNIDLYYYTYNNIIKNIDLYDKKFEGIYSKNMLIGKKSLKYFLENLLNKN